MIKSQVITLKLNEPLSTELIENELKQRGINPIRWAIVKRKQRFFDIVVSFETDARE